MTEGQTESTHDFRKDVVIVLKHYRFILLLFLGALVVAVVTGLAADSDYTATAEVTIEVKSSPVRGPDVVPTLDTFATLAESDDVAEDVAARLQDGRTVSDLKDLITIQSVSASAADPRDRIIIKSEGSSSSEASSLANAWADIVAEKAAEITIDPEALQFLQEIEAAAMDRLQEADPTVDRELATVKEELRAARQNVASLQARISELEDALVFIEAHPDASLDELRVAFVGLLADLDSPPYETVEELASGLRLREDYLEELVPGAETDVEELVQREEELTLESGERAAAESALRTARQDLATVLASASAAEVVATVTGSDSEVSGGVNWLARIGAAAAFGLVAGVAGAFALEYLGLVLRSWSRRSGPTPPEER